MPRIEFGRVYARRKATEGNMQILIDAINEWVKEKRFNLFKAFGWLLFIMVSSIFFVLLKNMYQLNACINK